MRGPGPSSDRMYTTLQILKGILDANHNRTQIRKVIRNAWEHDCDDFFVGLDLATNPFYDFGLTLVPAIEDDDDGDPGILTFEEFHRSALNLASGSLADINKRKILEGLALSANVTEWNLWYRRILLKTLGSHLPMDHIRDALIYLTGSATVLANNDALDGDDGENGSECNAGPNGPS